MRVKMLENATYSYDGKTLLKFKKGATTEEIHDNVLKQWLDRKICKELPPLKKKAVKK